MKKLVDNKKFLVLRHRPINKDSKKKSKILSIKLGFGFYNPYFLVRSIKRCNLPTLFLTFVRGVQANDFVSRRETSVLINVSRCQTTDFYELRAILSRTHWEDETVRIARDLGGQVGNGAYHGPIRFFEFLDFVKDLPGFKEFITPVIQDEIAFNTCLNDLCGSYCFFLWLLEHRNTLFGRSVRLNADCRRIFKLGLSREGLVLWLKFIFLERPKPEGGEVVRK